MRDLLKHFELKNGYTNLCDRATINLKILLVITYNFPKPVIKIQFCVIWFVLFLFLFLLNYFIISGNSSNKSNRSSEPRRFTECTVAGLMALDPLANCLAHISTSLGISR